MIRVTGAIELDAKLAGAEQQIERALDTSAAESIDEITPRLAGETPKRTGDLWRSEDLFQPGPAGALTFEASVEYASFVHDGTRFMRANPFLDRSIDAARPRVVGIYSHNVDEAVDAE